MIRCQAPVRCRSTRRLNRALATALHFRVVGHDMDDRGLSEAFDRADRALQRIERALAARTHSDGRDEALRARVRDAVRELDQLIGEAVA